MSIRVLALVWDDPELTDQGELLVLLALADFSNDQGECWPSIKSIAEKARMKERGVYAILDRLIKSGKLARASGGGRAKSNHYRVLPRAPRKTLNGKQCLQNSVSNAGITPETLHETTINPAPNNKKTLHQEQGNHKRTIKNQRESMQTVVTLQPELASDGKPSLSEFLTGGYQMGVSEADCKTLWEEWSAADWCMSNGEPIVKWRYRLLTWRNKGILPSQRINGSTNGHGPATGKPEATFRPELKYVQDYFYQTMRGFGGWNQQAKYVHRKLVENNFVWKGQALTEGNASAILEGIADIWKMQK